MTQIFNSDRTGQPRDLREGLGGASHYDGYVNRLASIAWMTPLIIAANVVVFVAMAAMFHAVLGFAPAQLAAWGGNAGTLDLAGQWWRLLTYQFLHMNLLHVGINMWVMWSVGRFTERLYGSFTLLFLYLAAGIFGGLASIVWNPDLVSVGASGSIFGVLGALLALLFRSRNEVPISVMRYWLPALLFVIFNLVNGAYEPGTDNACHVGGLLAGFGLGAIIVRPIESRRGFPLTRFLVAGLFAILCAIPPLWYLGALDHRPTLLEQFARTHPWYVGQEATNLQLWQALAQQAASGTISNDDLGTRFEHDILPFWKQAAPRLQAELNHSGRDRNPFLPLLAEFAKIHLDWAQAIVRAMHDSDQQAAQEALAFAQQTQIAQAKIDRLRLRTTADSLPLPLADSTIANWIKDWIPGQAWHCIVPPAAFEKAVAATDDANDGPVARHEAGCLAQQMFMHNEFGALDSSLRMASRNLSDLPDGSSHLAGMWAGLDDLFSYGNISVDDAFRRTSEWRRTVPGSVDAELAEAMMFRAWAYGARGYGYASTVSPQALLLYSSRVEMAAEGLREVKAAASNEPEWYQLSLGVGRDQALPIEQQRAIFEAAAAKFPTYISLYHQILVSLMPRWSGSDILVDRFILDASEKSGDRKLDAATYARLYLIYGNLEGNDYNVLTSSNADVAIMRQGLALLRQRYPRSDYILNATARFACIGNNVADYRAIRPLLDNHVSATAWPDKLSIASCDNWSR